MVVDEAIAFVISFNPEPRNLTETRDYASPDLRFASGQESKRN